MSSDLTDPRQQRTLLDEIDERQNDLLDQLDELNARVEALLLELTSKRQPSEN